MTALNPRFNEGDTRTLRFPGTSEFVVQNFLYWLFHRSISWPPCSPQFSSEQVRRQQDLATHLWIFGDQHLLPALQNLAIAILENRRPYHYPDLGLVRLAYTSTRPQSPLRRLFLKLVVQGLQELRLNPAERKGYSPEEVEDRALAPGFVMDLAAFTAAMEPRYDQFYDEEGYMVDRRVR